TEIISVNKFQKIIEENILRKEFSPYQRLRLVEGFYCSIGKNIPELKKIISNPQFYALKLKDNNYTMKLINEIKIRHTTTCINHWAIIA
ncbi:MAG: hypothetical protein Q9M37_08870, partial [Desulfonauticus sp.]|nr:hypothetical protein [Desulfonauticus sp.]